MADEREIIGRALAKDAMRHGGFTTPEIEFQRATEDLGREPTVEDLQKAGLL